MVEDLLLVGSKVLIEVVAHFIELAHVPRTDFLLLVTQRLPVDLHVPGVKVSELHQRLVERVLAEEVVDDLVHLLLHLIALEGLLEEVLELGDQPIQLLLLRGVRDPRALLFLLLGKASDELREVGLGARLLHLCAHLLQHLLHRCRLRVRIRLGLLWGRIGCCWPREGLGAARRLLRGRGG